MIVAGIDPGLRGAIAVASLSRSGSGDFEIDEIRSLIDLPVTTVDSGQLVDARQLRDVLEEHGPAFIVLEWPGPRPAGAASHGGDNRSFATEWRFALGCGATLAVCQAACRRVVLYAPNAWKGAMRLGADKRASIAAARAVAEGHEVHAALTSSKDGRAEALLLIEHFRQRLNEGDRIITS